MQEYNLIIIKLALGLIGLVVQINLLGKGNLAPSSALDQVQNYVLGGIIGGVIYNNDISVRQFFMVLVIWTLLVFILRFLKNSNQVLKKIIDGKPVSLIQNGQVNVTECLKSGISANELMFKLRANGIYEVENVKRAVLEQNGQLTLIEFGDENIRYPLIVDGQANDDVLELINHDEAWLLAQVQKRGFNRISDIYLGEYLSGKIRLAAYEETE